MDTTAGLERPVLASLVLELVFLVSEGKFVAITRGPDAQDV